MDVIVHNAWKVDFNHTLESFISVHIQGVRNLVDWSTSSARPSRIMFVSSISSVGNWRSVYPDAAIPEELVFNHHVAQGMGYAESKNVAECILGIASGSSGVPVSILRVGQIAGPAAAAGIWNRDEWFPSLIKISLSLECLPSYLPDTDWIPVEHLAAAVCEFSHFAAKTDESLVYNLVNPHTTSWTSLIDTVLKRLGPQVRTVDLSEWIKMLEQVDESDVGELTTKPEAKVLEFFLTLEKARAKGHTEVRTQRGISTSETFAALSSVTSEWMKIWMDRLGY